MALSILGTSLDSLVTSLSNTETAYNNAVSNASAGDNLTSLMKLNATLSQLGMKLGAVTKSTQAILQANDAAVQKINS